MAHRLNIAGQHRQAQVTAAAEAKVAQAKAASPPPAASPTSRPTEAPKATPTPRGKVSAADANDRVRPTRGKKERELTPSAKANERKDIFERMSPALQVRVASMERRHSQTVGTYLHYVYSLGCECREIAERPHDYDAGGIGLVLDYFDVVNTGVQIRKCRKFAELYNQDQYNELVELRNEHTNFRLTWQHVIVLLSLANPERREEYARKTVQRNWEVAKLRAEVQALLGTKGSPNSGRPHVLPVGLDAQARQMAAVSKVWLDKMRKSWAGDATSVFRNLEKVEAKDVTEELVNAVEEAKRSFGEIVDEAEAGRESLQDLINSLNDKRKNLGQAATADEESDDE